MGLCLMSWAEIYWSGQFNGPAFGLKSHQTYIVYGPGAHGYNTKRYYFRPEKVSDKGVIGSTIFKVFPN